MNNPSPLLIEDENLSHAWGRVVLSIVENPGKEISPLIISITSAQENSLIRNTVDGCLEAKNKQKVSTVANTIFPYSLWRRSQYNRHRLFERYLEILPRIKQASIHKNRRGLYFERLISYGSGPCNGNQLEFIISQYSSRIGVRKSMFQASVFDPGRDHTNAAQLPFPCLQHISFVPQGGNLILNAFYATQKIFIKAYGNYLGLYELGEFMGHEMNLNFSRMNCFIGVAKLDGISKTSPEIVRITQTIRDSLTNSSDVREI